MEAYPELSHYTTEDALMPVSSILLRQLQVQGRHLQQARRPAADALDAHRSCRRRC
jgi:hypothetical protein